MNLTPDFERCLAFINCQLKPGDHLFSGPDVTKRWRAVTLSRESGCCALAVAERLRDRLQAHEPKTARPWTVFDRNLVEQVLEDHRLPSELARFMPENRVSQIEDTLEELFGLHPPSWILVRQTAETILRLAECGNVILIGRGANIITNKRPHVFHVRLVGSLACRLEKVQQWERLERKAAMGFIRRTDRGRAGYVRKYFAKDIEDPLLYHLVVNTDLVSSDQTARIISEALLET